MIVAQDRPTADALLTESPDLVSAGPGCDPYLPINRDPGDLLLCHFGLSCTD